MFLLLLYNNIDKQFWIDIGKDTVAEKLKYVNKKGVAKNIIMFLGDGLSLPTLTASRIYKGQMKSSGENEYLSFERFPFVGMSKVSKIKITLNTKYILYRLLNKN